MNNRDYKYFDLARQEAKKSTFGKFNMGCVIVYHNRIIGRGSNSDKTDPSQKHYNRERNLNKNSNKPIRHSRHAEISALKNVPYPIASTIDWSKVKVYIYRISPGHDLHMGMARPCAGCMKALREKGIRRIYYSTKDGFAKEELY